MLLVALTLTMLGLTTYSVKTEEEMSKQDMWSVMGKPTYESTADSLNTKIWILTQAKHKKIMNGKMGQMMHSEKQSISRHPTEDQMNDSTMGMDMASKNERMEGTHFIMLDVTNTLNGQEIINGSAKMQIVYPSKKNLSVDLKVIMSHFGSALKLNEKGKYLFTINVDFGGGYKTTQFKYLVK
jgi:hypothetical protein